MRDEEKCPLGDHEATRKLLGSGLRYRIKCEVCGGYEISREAMWVLEALDSPVRGREHMLSGLARQRFEQGDPITILKDNVENLVESVVPPRSPEEVLDNTLTWIGNRVTDFYEYTELRPDTDYPLAFAKSHTALQHTLRHATDSGYVARKGYLVRLTPKGWERLDKIRSGQMESNQAFVAMWFAPEMEAVWKSGFKPALEAVGFRASRIDEEQFNDKIDDRIIAAIRRSGLLVADVTRHRQGVYFEAGFAMGLGRPVIWTCSRDDIDKAHFDTRQYNHIVWEDATDLQEKLINRIEATLPARTRRAT